MASFFTAYVEAALWSSTDNADESGGEPLDKNFTSVNIDPDTLAKMKEDADKFQRLNASDLEYLDAAQAGHDFWLTRNGHGAGFWDRDLGELGDRLTASAEKFGTFDLYVGDDGQIHGS